MLSLNLCFVNSTCRQGPKNDDTIVRARGGGGSSDSTKLYWTLPMCHQLRVYRSKHQREIIHLLDQLLGVWSGQTPNTNRRKEYLNTVSPSSNKQSFSKGIYPQKSDCFHSRLKFIILKMIPDLAAALQVAAQYVRFESLTSLFKIPAKSLYQDHRIRQRHFLALRRSFFFWPAGVGARIRIEPGTHG